MMSDLLGAAALGLHNLLIITGDPPKMGPYPDATAVFDIDSIGLTNMVNKLNHGLDLGNNPIGCPTAFSIGVGVNPGAVNLEEEIRRFEWKVEAGAEYAITQPVFDTEQLKSFLDKISHVRIPIVAGIWPLISYRNAEFMHNEVPGVNVTPEILERMRVASDKGKEFAREEGSPSPANLYLKFAMLSPAYRSRRRSGTSSTPFRFSTFWRNLALRKRWSALADIAEDAAFVTFAFKLCVLCAKRSF